MGLFNRLFLVMVTVLTAACHTNKQPQHHSFNAQRLQEANRLLRTSPQRALHLLDSLACLPASPGDSVLLLKGKAQILLGESHQADSLFKIITARQPEHAIIKQIALFELAKTAYYKGAYQQCLQMLDSISAHNTDSLLVGWITLYRGKLHRVNGAFLQSQKSYHASRKIALSQADTALTIAVTLSMGKNYLVEGNKPMAIKNYLDAYKLSLLYDDYLLVGDVCNHLGNYYALVRDSKRVLEYHHRALGYRIQLGAPEEIGQSYNNIGKCYLDAMRYDSASLCFEQAIRMFQQSGYLKGTIKTLTNLGKLYHSANEPMKAKQSLQNALTLSRKANYQLGFAEASLALGNLYLSQIEPNTAISHFNDVLKVLQSTNYDELLANVYDGLYQAWQQKGNLSQAITWHEKLLETEKERLNVETNRQMTALLLDFDFERQEATNQLLRKDVQMKAGIIRRNQLIIILAVIVIMLISGFCWVVYQRLQFNQHATQRLEALNEQISHQNKELENVNKLLNYALRDKDKIFSIISHELRNPLFWLKNLTEMLSRNHADMEKKKLKRTMLTLNESAQNVYHLMDNLLYWSRSQLNRIEPRFKRMNVNEKLMELIQSHRAYVESKELLLYLHTQDDLVINVDPDLFTCTIRNLLSNAIKFTPANGVIRISSSYFQNQLKIELVDNGKGMPPDLLAMNSDDFFIPGSGNGGEAGSGLGLRLCREFVNLHHGKLWIDDNFTAGTRIVVTWPSN